MQPFGQHHPLPLLHAILTSMPYTPIIRNAINEVMTIENDQWHQHGTGSDNINHLKYDTPNAPNKKDLNAWLSGNEPVTQ